MPWLIVRLAWGSRSTHRTRLPRSTNAAARFSVVVVLATPPLWLVKAMTLAFCDTGASGSVVCCAGRERSNSPITGGVFPRAERNPSLCPAVTSPLYKRLVLVTGKGGVGKTTVAAALGLAAARRGKRVILCELGGHDRLPELVPELTTVSVDPEQAKQEWLRYQLKSRTLAGVLGGSRLFQYLTAAAPGLSELVTIGKVWDLAQIERRTGSTVFDVAIVDAPATGHALAMLRSPSTFAAVASRIGPVGRHAATIDRSLRDGEHAGLVIAAPAEATPVNTD